MAFWSDCALCGRHYKVTDDESICPQCKRGMSQNCPSCSTLRASLATVTAEKEKAEGALCRAIEVLGFYGDPKTYMAISVVCDPPCGDFSEDYSRACGDDRARPGKRARELLFAFEKELPTLLPCPHAAIAERCADIEGMARLINYKDYCWRQLPVGKQPQYGPFIAAALSRWLLARKGG